MLARLTPEQAAAADQTIAEHPNWSLGKLQAEIGQRIGRAISRQAVNKRLDRLVRNGQRGDDCVCPVCGQAGTLQSVSAHWRQMAGSGKHPPFDRQRLLPRQAPPPAPAREPGHRLSAEDKVDNVPLPGVLDNVDHVIANKVLTERDFYRERYLVAQSELERRELRVRELERLLQGPQAAEQRYGEDYRDVLQRRLRGD